MGMLAEYDLQPDAGCWSAERAAALAGYVADAPVSDDFMQTSKAVGVIFVV